MNTHWYIPVILGKEREVKFKKVILDKEKLRMKNILDVIRKDITDESTLDILEKSEEKASEWDKQLEPSRRI